MDPSGTTNHEQGRIYQSNLCKLDRIKVFVKFDHIILQLLYSIGGNKVLISFQYIILSLPNLTKETSAAKEADEGGAAAEPLHRRGRLRGPVRVDARRRGGPLGAGPRRLQPRVPLPPHLHGAGGERYLREVLQVCHCSAET